MGVGLASMTLGTPVVAPTVTVLVSVVNIVVVGVTVVTGLRVDVGLIVSLKVGVKVVRGVSNTIGIVVVLSAISDVFVTVRVMLCTMVDVVVGVARLRQLHAVDNAELAKLISTGGTLLVSDAFNALLEALVVALDVDVMVVELVVEAVARMELLALLKALEDETEVFLVDVVEGY